MSKNIIEDGVFFTIKEVAEQVGVVPATIRNWEKEGVFTAKRTPSGYRIYTLDDIDKLKTIRHYSKEESMGMSAIRRFCSAQRPSNTVKSADDRSVVSKKLLSQKWKEYRIQRGYLLDDVANEVGISSSYLSKIENGQANVSYDVLQRMAAFYGENMLYFINTEEEDDCYLVRQNEGKAFSIGIEGVAIEPLIALKKHTLSAMLYTVEPGAGRDTNEGHSGEEFVHVLAGRVKMEVNGQECVMRSGDSITFPSSAPHGWRNCGKSVAKILWVYTPLVGD